MTIGLLALAGCSTPAREQGTTGESSGEKVTPPLTATPWSDTSAQNELVKRGEPLSFEGLTVYTGEPVDRYIGYPDLFVFRDVHHLHDVVIFRGKKEGLSVPVTILNDDGTEGRTFCETPIRVLEVYYGDLQAGALITHDEHVRVVAKDGETQLSVETLFSPIVENEEYIFLFSVSNGQAPLEGVRYGSIDVYNSYHKLADYELYKQKAANGTATMREYFGYDVMRYYLSNPNTKLDLYWEVSKYVENLPKKATQEELLQAVPQEHQALFHRMIKQYGVIEPVPDQEPDGCT